MSRILFTLVMILACAAQLSAQDFIATTPKARDIQTEQSLETKPTIEGIVKDVFVTRKPWQLVNPAAPAKYGSGEKKISKDFGPGTPFKSTGWIVAGVEW